MKKINIITVMILLFITLGCSNIVEGKIFRSKERAIDYFKGEQLVLAKAIEKGNLSEVIKLAPHTDLNKPAKDNITLLFFAIIRSAYDLNNQDRLDIITKLVKAGADPLQPKGEKNKGASPAEFVANADKGIWLKALLDGGLSPNAKSRRMSNRELIFYTVQAKNTETLKVLLDYGANPNVKTYSVGFTPLMEAFYSNNFEHMKLLLERGANPNPIDNNNKSLMAFIKRESESDRFTKEYKEKCKEILKLMISKGAKE